MKYEVRYYSRSGNVKAIAEAVAQELEVEAVSVDQPQAMITQTTDVLFIGGALYAYGLDEHLKTYLNALDGSLIHKAVIFSSTWISRHSIELIRKALMDKGIETIEEAFYVRGKPSAEQLKQAKEFARKYR